jgi:N,N-dimethylformamidase
MHEVDESRIDLAREYRANPLGPHSSDLQKLLKILRWEPFEDRIIAVQPQRNGPWHLARSTGRKGSPIEVFDGTTYATNPEAQWAIFRKRWERHTGQPLTLEGDLPLPAASRPRTDMTHRAILGYADSFSVRNGERIEFKVSAEADYRVTIERLRCGDEAGVGLKMRAVDTEANRTCSGRVQPVTCGSYVAIARGGAFDLQSFSLIAHVWPTMPKKGRGQVVMGGEGYALSIDANGALSARVGQKSLALGAPLLERHWYVVAASYDAGTGELWVGQRPLVRYAAPGDTLDETMERGIARPPETRRFRLAAGVESGGRPTDFYNGKIAQPRVFGRALRAEERKALLAGRRTHIDADGLVASWDFSQEISGTRVVDTSPHGLHGDVINLPTRAMKGPEWDGSEYNWTHKPEHYDAIHFHDDDLHDCGWETDFGFDVPVDFPSGLYCAHLVCDGEEDYVPFVVSPGPDRGRAPLALLLPTASYWAYGNTHHHLEWREGENVRGVFTTIDATTLFLHEHPEFGCSMYDHHSDGSGVCYASRLRPILNMRPRERLWQLPADTHIIDWLEEKGLAFDVITEDDLDQQGEALLAPYRCILTGTHPEYPSKKMLEAFDAYQKNGGRFIYLGGNGFYWRTSYHPTLPGIMEMRRAEDGIRTWAAEGGEYYHSFTGELGGMWRRMGRAPQSVAGVGMTAQGFDLSTYFERTERSFDPRVAFAFAGIGAQERIGDFGLIGAGAAGWEVDRADPRLGTPPHALVVATATDFTSSYHWMKEELTHTHSAITGETCPMVRCDMVFYETPGGGAVFSMSSIAWAGALSHNGYENNVSRITENVLRRFIDPRPL